MLPHPNPKDIDRKKRLALPHQPVAKQEPEYRVRNFDEVCLPYDEESAITEAMRCIQCPAAPCRKACPLHNDIPLALWQLEHGEFEDAATVFRRTRTMSEICGRVCPQVVQCEGACVYVKKGEPPVAIGRLEAFVADYQTARGDRDFDVATPTGWKVAVVGAGPAGLTVAQLLTKRGHAVTMFDSWPSGGGVGVRFEFDTTVGKDVTVDDLFDVASQPCFSALALASQQTLEYRGRI